MIDSRDSSLDFQVIAAALHLSHNNPVAAAKRLGVGVGVLGTRMEELGMDWSPERDWYVRFPPSPSSEAGLRAGAEKEMRKILVVVLRERFPSDAGLDDEAIVAKHVTFEKLDGLITFEARRRAACERLDRVLLGFVV